MKKSEATVRYVLFSKATALDIDPILFSSAINYIISHPKQQYDKTDIVPSINQFVSVVGEHLKIYAASMKPIFGSLDKHDYVNTVIVHFAERHGTSNFVDYVFKNCKNEIMTIIDYREMVDTGFSEQDMMNAINHYV